MSGVLQTGNVTPGHIALWSANGVLADGSALGASQKVLARASCDFNSTADQPLLLPSYITAFMLTNIIVTNAPLSLTTAVGGFYPAVSKGGTAIVAAGQVYSTLIVASKLLSCTLTGTVATTRYSRANLTDWAIYLSLTTPQGSATMADCYVLGIDLS